MRLTGPEYHSLSQRPEDDQDDSDTIAPSIYSTRSGKSIVKPPTYYGEGSFDPPSSNSSASEEEEGLLAMELEKPPMSPGLAESGLAEKKKKRSSLRFLITTILILLGFSALIGLIAARTYVGTGYRLPGTKKVTMDHIFNGTFSPQRNSVEWVPEAGDGVFSINDGGIIKLVDLKMNETRNLVDTSDIKDENGNRLYFSGWKLSPDMKYILIKTGYLKQWRWSSYGNYYIHNIEAKTSFPITTPTNPPTTAYATWSNTGESVAFVQDNDLYVLMQADPTTQPIRITTTPAASKSTLFNGVPDWVYEEEVFSAPSALWFSPTSNKLAFLRFNESAVDEFVFPIYNPSEDSYRVNPYTSEVRMRYPKPGYANPIVGVYVVDLARVPVGGVEEATVELSWEGRHRAEDSIISEVAWVGDDELIVKEVNRNADDGNVVFFNLASGNKDGKQGIVVRKQGKNGEEGDDGWIESSQNIYPVDLGYLDIVPTPEGFNHIALFAPANSSTPIWLTKGEWEVTGGIKGVGSSDIYFEGTKESSVERHLYSVPLPTSDVSKIQPTEPKWLTKPSTLVNPNVPVVSTDVAAELNAELTGGKEEQAFFDTDFSPEAGFYVLSYLGPNVPWQRIIKNGDEAFDYVLSSNEHLVNVTGQYEMPTVIYDTIKSDGVELNVKELRPPRMDDSGRTKYPVLFHVYGGPASQQVNTQFTSNRDWHYYVACSLGYIVVTIDGRGTGFKGRKMRNWVKGNLGFFETKDQIEGGKVWAGKKYVDPKRVGIWGWSYGGFMASKVAEANEGVHSLSMAVAPVTSWRLYDSIYTERYMNLPELNPGGYINASISNVTGFHNINFLLAHGSGDDNVHYANSAHLLDMLTKEGVRGWRFRMFTDSDHSINRRGAYRELYEFLTEFLVEKWGKGGRRRGW
ncbi:Dipeptidyl peptidase 4 [Marasmius crinis-equi]|uniref:Dipeptidyl peptidase 4 n=1 Tax=Marasmius crinis-equi TaxID=585013 RepID=A0ABR3F3Z9_9AGAR